MEQNRKSCSLMTITAKDVEYFLGATIDKRCGLEYGLNRIHNDVSITMTGAKESHSHLADLLWCMDS